METTRATDLLATLAHDGRLRVLRLLLRRLPDAVRPGEMAEALDLKPSTLSVYLGALERAGLVDQRREGRSLLYRARPDTMGALVDYLVADAGHGRRDLSAPRAARTLCASETAMTDRPWNVLFICTGNSARSIIAEALLRHHGQGRFVAHSAGTQPYSALNPMAVDLLRRAGLDTAPLRAKTVQEFRAPGAPVMDFVFTVCDRAANEDCPPWEGQPVTAHWGLPDPVKVTGTEAERALAFAQTHAMMQRRILAFTALPVAQLDRMALQRRLDEIGTLPSA